MRQNLPRSVVVIVGLHLLAAIVFGAMVYIDRSAQFPDLVINDDAKFATGLYANRNLGVGLALLVSLLVRSRLMILGLMIARFVTDVGDLVMALSSQELTGGETVGQLIFFGALFASELWVIQAVLRAEGELPATVAGAGN